MKKKTGRKKNRKKNRNKNGSCQCFESKKKTDRKNKKKTNKQIQPILTTDQKDTFISTTFFCIID